MDILLAELVSLDLLEEVMSLVFIEVEKVLLYSIVPDFWLMFNEFKEDGNVQAVEKCEFQMFRKAVAQLYLKYRIIHKTLERAKYIQEKSGSKYTFKFDEIFKSSLLSQLPPHFSNIVHAFYHIAFKVFIYTKTIEDDEDEYMDQMEERQECPGCESLSSKCQCQDLVNAFTETNLCLNRMGLLDRISGFTLTNLIQDQISKHIHDKCRGNFDTAHLKTLEQWLDTIVVEWLTRIYNNGSSKVDPSNTKIFDSTTYFKMKLKYFLFEKYANTIIDQFFNIIIDFPDSQPAINDLRLCMEKLDLRSHLVETLKNSIETRLLHPGVDTSDIITGYVATIKTMRHLEKSGILLQTVTEPVKEYLRKGRQDTVRCVITSLIEETPSDLSEELARSEAIKAEETERNQDEMNNWEIWNPDPIDADPEKHSAQNRKSDIISMIVDIYGTKELFVNEYRTLLAERVLTQLDFTPEKEIKNLELLKLRFGETLLHSCEVMLKDISDSKRINTHIQSAAFANRESGCILWHPFWQFIDFLPFLQLHRLIRTSQLSSCHPSSGRLSRRKPWNIPKRSTSSSSSIRRLTRSTKETGRSTGLQRTERSTLRWKSMTRSWTCSSLRLKPRLSFTSKTRKSGNWKS